MPSFDIVRKSTPKETFRVKSIIGKYDLQQAEAVEHFQGSIDLPDKWNIGCIVGHSGTGKTTIARELFGNNIVSGYDYTHDNILDDMPSDCEVNEIAKTLTSVGFSTPPSWLKPYHVLSNGEKMRCDIARAILENKNGLFVFDEFTSVVDRTVAQVSSLAIQKAIRRNGSQFIAVTCHEDVVDWLMPDWVFDTNKMKFERLDFEAQKKNRPKLQIDIYKTDKKQYYWNIFRKYHYLSHSFNNAAKVFIAFCNDSLCGFCATLPFPHPFKKNTWKEHRTVVLPDFQGIGIGSAFTDAIAQKFIDNEKCFISTTSNPGLIFSRARSKKWRTTHIGRKSSGSGSGRIQNKHIKGSTSANRITVSFEYVGTKSV
ncbi:MAG: GNAT family N-acetyltransferase [Clostridiales bacterium]|nr:GNAT family N-acetyltransferase [Clostridiales bacterium]